MNKITKWNFPLFIRWVNKKPHRLTSYLKLGSPTPFDVSLRDGIQSLSKTEQLNYTLQKKEDIFTNIMNKYIPRNIEVGSIVSNKVLPIMQDTPEFFSRADYISQLYSMKPNMYVLVPNMKNLEKAINIKKLCNFSFITSASNEFQLKNTNKTMDENKQEINNMINLLDTSVFSTDNSSVMHRNYKIKLYISCINECPLTGKINFNKIAEQIVSYKNMNINSICLSDTCGTLDVDSFYRIMNTCEYYGIPASKFSLHLHVNPNRIDSVKKIMFNALDRGITSFDVSDLSSGGCSVTMNKDSIFPNLSYDLYYETLAEYIENKSRICVDPLICL